MGREIKRVPFDFDWPQDKIWEGYQPSCSGCEHEQKDGHCGAEDGCTHRFEPPEGEGWQIWETVSEGSPNSPVFKTKEELIEHMHTEGAGGIFKPCTRAAARSFIETKWACSMMIVRGYSADGVNAYSAGIPPFLHGFDLLSDEIIDILKKRTGFVDKEIEELLLKFRERTDKFTQLYEAAGRCYMAVKKFEGELPDELKDTVKKYDELIEKLYGKET